MICEGLEKMQGRQKGGTAERRGYGLGVCKWFVGVWRGGGGSRKEIVSYREERRKKTCERRREGVRSPNSFFSLKNGNRENIAVKGPPGVEGRCKGEDGEMPSAVGRKIPGEVEFQSRRPIRGERNS